MENQEKRRKKQDCGGKGLMQFPQYRPRRLRQNAQFRDLVRETHVEVTDLVLPLFVCPGRGVKKPISSMPGNHQLSVDTLVKEVNEIRDLGIKAIILFGIPEKKDELGTEGYAPDGVVQSAIRAVKETTDDLLVMTDVCLCEYMSHGHCGVVEGDTILNDPTLELLSKMALSHAEAGADMVAPSDMMDGRIGAIRTALDERGFDHIPIMAYSAKFASSFYGPFREAAESPPQFGDRKSYQMDPANLREALREVALDIQEGADIVMVKPALPYLDVIHAVKDSFDVPVAAYNVSGEFAMIKAADQLGWINGSEVMMETLLSIKRAGADIILTYFAREVAHLLNGTVK
jgi:porphobilinogen synthase